MLEILLEYLICTVLLVGFQRAKFTFHLESIVNSSNCRIKESKKTIKGCELFLKIQTLVPFLEGPSNFLVTKLEVCSKIKNRIFVKFDPVFIGRLLFG